MNTMDLSDKQDYIVSGLFEGLEKIMTGKSLQNFRDHLKTWKAYVQSRDGIFLISRRFNLSAVRTHFLAYYSNQPTTGQNLWSLKGIKEEEAKILTLWFNSSLNLLQVYLQRMETGGTWMEINSGMINDFFIPNVDLLSLDEKSSLLKLFESLKNTPFMSILDQLKTSFAPRKEIDLAILRLVGYSTNDANRYLDSLYPALAKEIEKLTLMLKK